MFISDAPQTLGDESHEFMPEFHLAYHIPRLVQGPEKSKTDPRPNRRPKPRSASEQVRRDLPAGVDQALDGADRLVESLAVLAAEFDLDNALDTLAADHHGHADIHVLHTVFAVEIGGAGQHALLVLQIALRHRDRGCRWRVE